MGINKRGVTLLEMLVVLIILGIIVQIMSSLFIGAARWTSRLNKQVLAAQTASSAGKTNLSVASMTDKGTGYPVICFTNEQAYGCGADQPCEFTDGKWMRKNKACNDGVLLVK